MPEISHFTPQEIRHFFKNAHSCLKHPGLTVLCSPVSSSRTTGHILPIVSKKIGNAPTRNKLKRQLRAIFYENNLYSLGFDIAVITRPAITQLSYQELQALLTQACTQLINNKKTG